MINRENDEQRWSESVIDCYEPLKYTEGWYICTYCGCHPRIWIFDNGRFARCQCGDKYGEPQARAESILSHINRTDGSVIEYDYDALRIVWNLYVMTGQPCNQLPEGQW